MRLSEKEETDRDGCRKWWCSDLRVSEKEKTVAGEASGGSVGENDDDHYCGR